MMSADVLRFGDFTTKSGRKTPYFVNTGNYKTGLRIPAWASFTRRSSRRRSAAISTRCSALRTRASRWRPRFPARLPAYGIDKPFSSTAKEAKDHGEGGSIVGYKPQDGDRVISLRRRNYRRHRDPRNHAGARKAARIVKVTDMFTFGQAAARSSTTPEARPRSWKLARVRHPRCMRSSLVQDIREFWRISRNTRYLPLMEPHIWRSIVYS